MKKTLVISFLILGLYGTVFADHITGGEMYYRFLGEGNGLYQYRVLVKLFKNCHSNRQLVNPAIVSVFDRGTNERIKDITVALNNTETLTLTDPNKCITNPPSVCYEIGYYDFDVSLPASEKGYVITCQVVFRIAGINNLISNYGSIGATYTAEIPSTGASQNNSARFTGNDMVVVCANNSFSYSFAAEDTDGDQLRYSFCEAYQGGFFGGSNQPPPASPPYNSVPYGASYNGSAPLGKNVQINSQTGLLKGIAPPSGIYVVTVCVEEIRNGLVIARQRKDLQINVSDCSIAAASLLPEYMLCKDTKTISLSNFSTSPLVKTYTWELSDAAGARIFNSSNPGFSYTFPDTGIYHIKLLINKDLECSDSITSMARVYPGLKTGFNFSGICFNKPTSFINTTKTVYGSIDSWRWDFGESTHSDDFSDKQNPVYLYPTMGQKNVQLMVSTTKGCFDTLQQLVTIVDKPPIKLAFRDTLICVNDKVQLMASGSGSFNWSPAAGIINGNTATPIVSPAATTLYFVDMNDNGCLNRDSVKVRVTNKVFLQAMNDTTICQGDPIQLKINSDGFTYTWNNPGQLSNPFIANPVAITHATTTYEVTANIGGCSAKDQVVVKTIPYPKVQAGPDTTICFKGMAQLMGSSDGSSVNWSPAGSLYASNSLSTVASPNQTTSYVLTVFDTKGCPKPSTDTVVVVVLPDIQPFAGRDTSVIMGQDLQLAASGGVDYRWSPALGLSATNIANPVAVYTAPSEGIRYKVLVYNEAGCADSSYLTVKVFATGPTVFVPNAFTPNGDGRNEKIRPVAVGMQRLEYFKIYNRWGELVYASPANDIGWDGTIGGKPQRSETYVWIVKAVDYNGKVYLRKGTLTLLR